MSREVEEYYSCIYCNEPLELEDVCTNCFCEHCGKEKYPGHVCEQSTNGEV